MPHTAVPAEELRNRLTRLREEMNRQAPDWAMIILENKIDLYYFTGTMQEGALVITPTQAAFFVRRSLPCARSESLFPDIRPMGSFRVLAEAFPDVPDTVHVATRTMTLQKLSLLQKYLPFSRTASVDKVLSALRSVKSDYEIACMTRAGKIHQKVIEEVAPTLLRAGVSEAHFCMEVCTALVVMGAMGISRFNQPMAEDVLGIASFGENSLQCAALDSPSGSIGTAIAMKSIGASERRLQAGDIALLDIPSGFRGYHTDKSICFFYGALEKHPKGDQIRAAREQCLALEAETASLLKAGAVPAEIYETILAHVDPAFRDGFMNGCKFLGHSIGLTMDETPVLAKGFTAPLLPNMTLAVEPKIALEGIGLVGSENTYHVMPEGPAKSLTGSGHAPFEING